MTEPVFPSVADHTDVTPERFQAIFAQQKPAILKNHVQHWPAVAAGKSSAAMVDYLKAMENGTPATVAEAPASSQGAFVYAEDLADFNFSKRQRPLSQALDLILSHAGRDDAPVVAIQMMPTAVHLPAFARDNPSPLLPPQVGPRLWVGGRMRTQIHNDADHNLACVIHGRRRFILFPPEQVGNLYIGPLDNPPPLSLARIEAPDFQRFPRFRAALDTAVQAELEPGDALFVPKHWWHHVTSLEPFNAMVNYWWGNTQSGLDQPYNTFQTALLAIKDLPSGQKAYWKAMFDAYVFQEGGDSVAHIPPALQGALGPLGPQMRDKLKRELLQTFLKG